jgi:NAD-dependent deacetylase
VREHLDQQIERLRQIIDGASNIVFFGGAGVSTESGIPDFRSQDGLYNQQYAYPPEEIVSRSFFDARTREFFEFYLDRVLHPDAKPNAAHLALAELERRGKLKAIVTQTMDGLHQAAGSKEVIELHGSTLRNYCMTCGAKYDLDYVVDALNAQKSTAVDGRAMLAPTKDDVHSTVGTSIARPPEHDSVADGIPHCSRPGCNGIVRPDVVLYEEQLSESDIIRALDFIGTAEVLIVGGTSLVVYPAASFLRYFKGSHLIILNKAQTSGDSSADLVIREPIGQVLGAAVD